MLCLGVLLTVPVFVTAAKVLLRVHVVQLVLTLVGMSLVVSLLWRVGSGACSGLFVCALGFAVGIASAVLSVRKLAR